MIGIFGTINLNIKKQLFLNTLSNLYTYESIKTSFTTYQYDALLVAIVYRSELHDNQVKNNLFISHQYIVLIDGYITNKNFVLSDSFISSLLQSINTNNYSELQKLSGEYTIFIYSRKNKKVYTFNDRFASRPFYFKREHPGILFGSERKFIFQLSQKGLEYSKVGLMQFLHFGHLMGNIDLYKNINVISPANIVTFDGEKIKNTKYWNMQYTCKKNKDSKNLEEELGYAIKSAGRDILEDKFAIGMGLSGGLDSRVIAAVIPRDKNVFARTFGNIESREVQIARQIANILGFEHFIEQPKDNLFSDFIYNSVWRSEGCIPFMGLKSILSHKNIKSKMLYNLGGQLGDVLTGKTIMPYMLNPFLSRKKFILDFFEDYIAINLKEKAIVKELFNQSFYKSYFNLLKESFIETFEKIEAQNICDLYTIWDMSNRQPRFTVNSKMVDNHLFFTINLFSDKRFVETALKLRPRDRFGQAVYKKAIYRCFPKIRNIKNANLDSIVKSSSWGNWYDLGKKYLNYKVFKKYDIDRLYDKGILIKRDKHLYNTIINFLHDSSFPDHILSRPGILSIVNEHYQTSKTHSNIIGLIATLTAANDLFFLQKTDCLDFDYLE